MAAGQSAAGGVTYEEFTALLQTTLLAVTQRCRSRIHPVPPPLPEFQQDATSGGLSLGRLVLGEEIGHGSYATVYRTTGRLPAGARQHLETSASHVVDSAAASEGQDDGYPGAGSWPAAGVCAVKAIRKDLLVREKKQGEAARERDAMILCRGSAHVLELIGTAQDAKRLYFISPLCVNGDLQTLLTAVGAFCPAVCRFYAVQIVAALGTLRDACIVHRDLKPDNILLSERMHVKLCDFACSRKGRSTSLYSPPRRHYRHGGLRLRLPPLAS